MLFLYEKYEGVKPHYADLGIEIPDFIIENLKYELREYQQDALRNFLYWDKKDPDRADENHVLFEMATGTGKTLLMAALMLYFHKQGYRKFLFFVDKINILEKTRQNFINSQSSKYLFSDNLEIDGKQLAIKPINNLDEADEDNINIMFTTTAGLHSSLTNEKENAPTFDDFANHKTVFLADEAHHLSSQTAQREIELEASWENTIERSFKKNSQNYLIELTATANLDRQGIREKYEQKAIFNYNLKQFRLAGYSKNIRVVDTKMDDRKRILLALVISEYRRFVIGRHKLEIKPVLLFKSKTISESMANYTLARTVIDEFQEQDLEQLISALKKEQKSAFLKNIASFIQQEKDFLLNDFSNSFHKERMINVNKEAEKAEQQLLLNSLEDKDNEIRVIFAVQKLNEGWDVLNLYDIVKLYEIQNAKTTSTSEIQLIGRGARYCPFVIDGDEDTRYKRKYDKDMEQYGSPVVLEQLHYHTLQENAFIRELNNQIERIGLQDAARMREVQISIKEEFINSDLFKNGYVFFNKRIEKEPRFRTLKKKDQSSLNDEVHIIQTPTENISWHLTEEIAEHAIGADAIRNTASKHKTCTIEEIERIIFIKALRKYDFFSHQRINNYIEGGVKSITELQSIFAASSITFYYNDLSQITNEAKLEAVSELLAKIRNKMDVNKKIYKGDKTFYADAIKNKFENIKRTVPDNISTEQIMDDTGDMPFFIQDKFYGDSSYEKNVIQELHKYFTDESNTGLYQGFHMIRNHGEVTLYNFENGKGFEPDFILFLKKGSQNITYQVFIEAKGEDRMKSDQWKEDFLTEICQIDNPDNIALHNPDYKIVGVPFYTEADGRHKITEKLEKVPE